jgi:hypothetical protein
MRVYLIKEFWDENWKEVLPVNNWYEAELTPTMYDSQTLQPAPPAYIVKCNDGKFRKADGGHFLTEEEWRERQLNQILSVSL